MSWIRTTSDALSAVPAPDHSFRNRLVISLLLVSAFVVILNETVMNVALPDLMKDPHGHQGVPVWIPITAGAVSLGGLVWRQLVLQRADWALLDLRVFRSGATATSFIEVGIQGAFVCGEHSRSCWWLARSSSVNRRRRDDRYRSAFRVHVADDVR